MAKKFYAGAFVGCSIGSFIEDGWELLLNTLKILPYGKKVLQKSSIWELSLDAPLRFH